MTTPASPPSGAPSPPPARPSPASDAPEYHAQHLADALVADGRLVELGLHVEMGESEVVVTGTVSTPERQQAVSAVVQELEPAKRVRNETVVASARPPETEEQL